MTPTIFLDRDGTINEDRGYVHRWDDFVLTHGAVEALRAFNEAGFRVVVVTNQSGVGRGYYTEAAVQELHSALDLELARHHARIDAYYYCVHVPDDDCACRKPRLGMFQQACRDVPVALADSWMIGDKDSDMTFAQAAGLRGIQITATSMTAVTRSAVTIVDAVRIVLSGRVVTAPVPR